MIALNRLTLGAAGVLLAATIAACGGASGAADTTPQPEAAAPKGPPPLPAPVTLSSRPDAGPGEKLFIEKCVMCHGPNGMGTGLLARRMDVALLEKRTDLPLDYIEQAARMGLGNMPAIPRGEVSDPQLRQIAEYLARNTPADMGGTAKGGAQ